MMLHDMNYKDTHPVFKDFNTFETINKAESEINHQGFKSNKLYDRLYEAKTLNHKVTRTPRTIGHEFLVN